MNYAIFAREHDNITTLDSREINDPVAALKDFLVGRSEESLKQDVQDLLIAVFEENGWRKHGTPINLYLKAKDMAKLIDLVWLITIYRHERRGKQPNLERHYLYKQYQHRTFTGLFKRTPSKDKPLSVSAAALAKEVFTKRHGLMLKSDITNYWLPVAFNSSYMTNLTAKFHCIESSTDVLDYRYLLLIVDAAFELANQPAICRVTEKLGYYRLFATDADHLEWLSEETIEQPVAGLRYPFFYIAAARFPEAIRRWYALISESAHWDTHSDPGNILYVRESILSLMEIGWLLSRLGFPKQDNSMPKRKYGNDLSAAETADPIGYALDFFEQRRLCEWKQLLETWLCQSLSDEDHPDTAVTERDRESIIKLMQALQLIGYRAIA